MRIALALRSPWLVTAFASLAVLFVAALCFCVTSRAPTGVTLEDGTGPARPVTLPYSAKNAPTTRPMDFVFRLRGGALTPGWFVLVPDDHLLSISVNGRELPLSGVPEAKLDDYQAGFSYPLGRELAPGDNRVVVRVLNKSGGPGGADVHGDPTRGVGLVEIAAMASAALVFLGAAMRAGGCAWSSVTMAAAGVLVRLAYLAVTDFRTRAHDADQHLDYVRYLLDHHAIPRATEGYAFYHPPLYYLASALTAAACDALRLPGRYAVMTLQLESAACDLGFVALAAATARLFVHRIAEGELGRGLSSRRGLTMLAAALIAFWPAGVMHAARIGNDDMTYLWFGACLYFASRWWLAGRAGKPAHFAVAAAFAALGVLTKTNSLILFAVLGALLLARLVRDRERGVRAILVHAGPLALLFVVSAGLALHEALVATLSGKQDVLLVANAHLNSKALAVGNRADNFLWFDLRTFVTAAFTSPWDDAKGRQYFWNYLLKTSLFGEWSFPGDALWNVAVILSVVCLAMLGVLLGGTLLRKRFALRELPLVATAAFLVAGLALVRMRIPNACTGDFRYIEPVILPMAVAYVGGITALRAGGWPRAARGGLALGWLFVLLSVSFVLLVVAAGS